MDHFCSLWGQNLFCQAEFTRSELHFVRVDGHEAKYTEQKGLTKMLSPGLVNIDSHIINTFHKYLASA